MPGGLELSYRSLSNDVYKSTTVPTCSESSSTFMQKLKKKFHDNKFASTHFAQTSRRSEPLISPAGDSDALGRTMPSADMMDDIELKAIEGNSAGKALEKRVLEGVEEVLVETDRGPLLVAIQGDRRKPAILTYHDLGLNYSSNFRVFFHFDEMRSLLDNFSVYHVNAPGQEEGAATLPDSYVYPTMDELAHQLNFVLSFFGLESVVGFGVGAGGNVLARFAYSNPDKVEALCLLNTTSTQAGWIEWAYQKYNVKTLKLRGMTQSTLDYLMWHHFGRGVEERNCDLAQVYRHYLEKCSNPMNLALFIESYIARGDLNITRDADCRRNSAASLAMPVLNITSMYSPHTDDTVTLNGRLNPTISTWMKISGCGMVLEEEPRKLCEAFRLFLQGLGYAVRVGRVKYMSASSLEGNKNVVVNS